MAQPTPGVHYDTAGKKHFIPLENHPAVFADLATRLGATPSISFHDVYSIDEPELRALVPRPVHALIFIAPAVVYYRVRELDAGGLIAAPGTWWYTAAQDESVNWFRQTIGNACGERVARVKCVPLISRSHVTYSRTRKWSREKICQ